MCTIPLCLFLHKKISSFSRLNVQWSLFFCANVIVCCLPRLQIGNNLSHVFCVFVWVTTIELLQFLYTDTSLQYLGQVWAPGHWIKAKVEWKKNCNFNFYMLVFHWRSLKISRSSERQDQGYLLSRSNNKNFYFQHFCDPGVMRMVCLQLKGFLVVTVCQWSCEKVVL